MCKAAGSVPGMLLFDCYRVTRTFYNTILQATSRGPCWSLGVASGAGAKMFLEHNGYVGRLPALMSTWQHRKRRAMQTVKIPVFTRSWRRGDTHRGARDNASLCMTPQGRLSQTREQDNALCKRWTSSVWPVLDLMADADADAGESGSPWHQGHRRNLCNEPETTKLKVYQASCGGASP